MAVPSAAHEASQPTAGAGVAAVERGYAGNVGGTGRARTTAGGDATRKKNDCGPAQRHAAQSPRSTSSGGGPQPSHDFSGRTSTPSSDGAPSATTQPRTLRPCSGTRTRVPTRTS